MVCQQFVGINGIGFYASETFVAAGKWDTDFFLKKIGFFFHFIFNINRVTWFAGLTSSNIGTIGYACIQVVDPYTSL